RRCYYSQMILLQSRACQAWKKTQQRKGMKWPGGAYMWTDKVNGHWSYLGVHLNNKLDWTDNTAALYRKGQSRLHLLRRLRCFGVQGALLRTFFDAVVASAIFYGVVCWGSSISTADRKRLNRVIKKSSSVLGCPLDPVEDEALPCHFARDLLVELAGHIRFKALMLAYKAKNGPAPAYRTAMFESQSVRHIPGLDPPSYKMHGRQVSRLFSVLEVRCALLHRAKTTKTVSLPNYLWAAQYHQLILYGEGAPQGNYVASGYSVYEEENEHLQEGLRAKVSALKHLSIDIGNEVKHQNKMLGEMDTDFDSTGGLLGATMGRLKLLSRGSQTKIYCYMLLFALLVFVVLYWVIKLR
ncbi:hypothetical protein NFI96_014045, partial [Prochilodus magdalenae]